MLTLLPSVVRFAFFATGLLTCPLELGFFASFGAVVAAGVGVGSAAAWVGAGSGEVGTTVAATAGAGTGAWATGVAPASLA